MIEILTALVLLNSSTQGQAPEVTFKLDNETPMIGTLVTGIVTVTFAPGLHGYQNPPSEDYMIPIVVSGGDLKGFQVRYPMGTPAAVGGETKMVMTYEGTVEFPVAFRAPVKAGKSPININVRYQLCNEQACFAPGNAKASLTINTVKPPAGWNAVKSSAFDAFVLNRFLGNPQ